MLDANLVAAVWGAIALYGVLASLLVPRTDNNYRTFLDKGTEETYKAAKYWARITFAVPLVALFTVLAVSLIAILPRKGVPLTWPPTSSLWVVFIGLVSQLFFLIFVGLLVTLFPPSYDLPVRNLNELETLKSRDFSNQTIVYFANETDWPINLYWIDYDGHEIFYGPPLGPKELRRSETFATHPWVARNQDGTPVALFEARKVPGRAVIKSSEAPRSFSAP